MKKIDFELITVAKKPKTGSIVLWDSDNLIHNTQFDMRELTKSIVKKESQLYDMQALLQKKARILAVEIVQNKANSAASLECEKQLQALSAKFNDHETIFLDQIKTIDSFDLNVLSKKEGEAQEKLQIISDYIVDLESLRLHSYILLTNLSDALNTIDVLEESTFSYRDKVNDLYNELLDLENRVNLILYQLATLKAKMEPAIRELYRLRIYSYDLLAKFKLIYSRLLKLEVAIAANFAKLCRADSLFGQAKQEVINLAALLSRLEARMTVCVTKFYALQVVIGEIFDTQMRATELANSIADFITKMTKFINEGLITGGDSVQIEYNGDGFAIIHANLPEYPKRIRPVQQCFPQEPITVTFPAPPCPPLIPPCPTTTTTTTTSTTKKPAPAPATCNVTENASGGAGTFSKNYAFAPWVGCVTVEYNMQNVPDTMDVFVDGKKVASTNGPVSGFGQLKFRYEGSGTVMVKVVGSSSGTVWDYQIKCGPC